MTTRAQKRRKIEEEKRRCSLEGVFWDPTMFPQLGQFLSINDTTNLGHTCKEMKRVVDTVCDAATSGNSSLAKIVWEKRRKTMIGYQGDDSDYDPNCCQVWQIQWFCFCLVSKESLQKMEVNISLDNIVWIERHNWLDPATMNPSPTWVKVIITAPQTKERLFSTYHEYDLSFLRNRWVDKNNVSSLSEESSSDLRFAMGVLYPCFKRIANWQHDNIEYPTADYMMLSLKSWLQPFFPEGLDRENAVDRITAHEFSYPGAAPTLEDWRAFIPREDGIMYEYSLDEIPWYNT